MIISQRKRYLESLNEQEKNKESIKHKHIYKNKDGKYTITKSVKGKHKYFGIFNNIDEALKYRDKLITNNWEPLPENDEQTYLKKSKQYYKRIYKSKGIGYEVYNNKDKYIGYCKTIEEALYFRDLYYNKPLEYVIKPYDLDLKINNPYIINGLKYPVPEKLKQVKTKYGKGSIIKKGPGTYVIQYGGKHICTCRTNEQAYYVREEMIKRNWDKSQLKEVLYNYPVWYTWLMELYKYVIIDPACKNSDGEVKYMINIPREYLSEGKRIERITGYKNIEDALFERDFLVANEWDYDLLVESIDDDDNPYYDMDLPPYPERKILNLQDINYHEEELTQIHELIQKTIRPRISSISKDMNVTPPTIRNWLKKWGCDWHIFLTISRKGVNPLTVLKKVKHYYKPDLSINKTSKFKGYISKNKTSSKRSPYQVYKGNVRFGQYPTLAMAKKVVRKLDECGWDKGQLKSIQESVGYKPVNNRNYVYPWGKYKWCVQKRDSETKKMISYGVYDDYDYACLIRYYMIYYDWDMSKLTDVQNHTSYIMGLINLIKSNMFHGNNNTLNEYNIS